MTLTEISNTFHNHLSGVQINCALEHLRKNKRAKSTRLQTRGRSAERWFAIIQKDEKTD